MKRIITYCLISFSILAVSCSAEDSRSECGTHNGKQLNIGPEGGCYYINSNGNKTYVDRSECRC
ncbi:hypothetical protein [Christiangramia sp. LLG6405-1]|uniref:hypothetical protein n=1 Tax=Christiangramia sp. LLG6405-1 TaxID=3160832 RepID=UPI003867FCDC